MNYAKSTGGFYINKLHGGNIPSDAVKITAEVHAALLAAQSSGKQITNDENGYPLAIDPPTPIRTQASLLAGVATKRWQAETGGIVVAGSPIKTDRESQAQLSSAYTSLKSGLIDDTPWKADGDTFVLVTLAGLELIAQAVATHVRACFAAEEAHCIAIAALQTQAELDAYDIDTGWPAGQ